MALGDVDKETAKVNCDIITNNGDRNKILATVAASIHTFSQNTLITPYI
ncbi:MAG: hypothetical protein IPJ13_25500 [Saprospiraceae bacterium]|nr:hypothetical protein [Saprospiraceae bacterium]